MGTQADCKSVALRDRRFDSVHFHHNLGFNMDSMFEIGHEYSQYIIEELKKLGLKVKWQEHKNNDANYFKIILKNCQVLIGCWFKQTYQGDPPGVYFGLMNTEKTFYLSLSDANVVQKLYEYSKSVEHDKIYRSFKIST